MGLGSFLGSALKFGTSFIPGVGPILSKVLDAAPILGGVADTLGGAAKAGQAQNNTRDQLRLALANQKLGRDKFALAAPGERMNTGIRAALASNAKPSSVKWGGPGSGLRGELPQFSGGIKSIYDATSSPESKQLTDRVLHDSLMAQLKGGTSGGGADTDMGEAGKVGESSVWDKVLGGSALGTSLLGGLGKSGILDKIKKKPGGLYDGVSGETGEGDFG